jgi:hypothetical protein
VTCRDFAFFGGQRQILVVNFGKRLRRVGDFCAVARAPPRPRSMFRKLGEIQRLFALRFTADRSSAG